MLGGFIAFQQTAAADVHGPAAKSAAGDEHGAAIATHPVGVVAIEGRAPEPQFGARGQVGPAAGPTGAVVRDSGTGDVAAPLAAAAQVLALQETSPREDAAAVVTCRVLLDRALGRREDAEALAGQTATFAAPARPL